MKRAKQITKKKPEWGRRKRRSGQSEERKT
jgi:hypothetical protein